MDVEAGEHIRTRLAQVEGVEHSAQVNEERIIALPRKSARAILQFMDVTDVAIRVIGGTNYLSASDAVQANDMPLPDTFPFLSTPWDGRNRIHQNP